MQIRHSSPVIKSVNPNWLSESAAILVDALRFMAIVFVALVNEAVFAVGPYVFMWIPGKRK